MMPGETPQLHLLAKAPLPGQAKTRLAPLLGTEGAADAHSQLVRHCVANACKALPADHITLWTALDHTHPLFGELYERFGVTLAQQPEGNLGARIRHALNTSSGPAMVMGSDCPSITCDLIMACIKQISTHDVVMLPAEDGGYGLIGTHCDYPGLFELIPWGSDRVLSATRQRIEALGLRASYPATVWDVDRPEDWQRWQAITSSM